MVVYYFLLLTPILIQHFSISKHYFQKEKKKRFALFAFFAIFALLIMLRHESVGIDTYNYVKKFNEISRNDWVILGESSVEIGFFYFNKIISVFFKDPQIFLAITAIVTLSMIYPTYKRLCVDPALTIVLFCTMSTFVMMFSGIRQMIAIGIGFIAYEFTRNKKLIPFLISVVIAMSFHTSAFMIIFMYPLYHTRITKKWLIVVVPLVSVIFLYNQAIFGLLALLLNRYTKYDTNIELTGAYTILILFVMFVIFAFLIPDEKSLDNETIGLRNFLLLATVLQMFAPLHTLAMRMNYYYIIFIPLLIPKIIENRSLKWKQLAIVGRHVMVVFFLIYFFISAQGEGNLNVFPYHFYWESIL